MTSLLVALLIAGFAAMPMRASPIGAERATSPAPLTGEQLAAFEQFVGELMATGGIPGASVAVVQDGEVVFLKGFGVRALGEDVPVTPDTLMMIGSVNKSLTSLLAATLVTDGRLTWETPVVSLLPGFALSDPALTETLTVRDAFCACTGLARHDLELAFNAAELTPEQLIASVANFPLTAPLGEVFQYSNQMYGIGGYAAATAATGASPDQLYDAYLEAMQTQVLDPLGMERSTFRLSDVLASGDYAKSHGLTATGGFSPVPLEDEEFFMGTVAPAGQMWSTAREMASYVQTELAGGVTPDGTRIVSEANRDVTWEQRVELTQDPYANLPFAGTSSGYALGWVLADFHGQRLIHHDGNTIGFSAEVAMLPESNLGITILTNAADANTFTKAVEARLFEIAFGLEPVSDAAAAIIEGADAALAEIGQHIGQLDAAAVEPVVGHYSNDALGDVTVTLGDDALVIDSGEARSSLLPYLDGGEVVAYIAVDQPLTMTLVAFEVAAGTPVMAIQDAATGDLFVFSYTGA